MMKIRSWVWLFLLVVLPVFGQQAGIQYPSRIPPHLHSADPAVLNERKTASERAAKFPRQGFVYTLRKASFTLNEDRSCTIALSDSIYVRRTPVTFNLLGSGQFKKAKVILQDGRWFETVPSALPSLPTGTLLILSGTLKVSAPSLLPMQQVVYEMQKTAPIARFEIDFSAGFHHKFYHVPDPLLRSRREADGRISYVWEGTVLPKIPCQNEAYPRSASMRLVLTTLSSWSELRKWALGMMSPEEKLDDMSRKVLRKLTAGVTDKTEQVRRIYNYLNGLRYLTVPVGEAKFRPQSVGSMLRNKYGDCKDKSNALYVFCRELGIPAERVLVNSRGQVDTAFPSWQFNHMIVRIPELPGYPNGLWLDAAGGQAPFGELPAGSLDTEGFVLADRTEFRKVEPADPEKVHSRIQEQIRISPDGNVRMQVQLKGIFSSEFRHYILRSGQRLRDEAEILLDSLIPGADMNFFQFQIASSSYLFKAKLPLSGYLPAMTVRNELVKPFIPSSIPRAIRLFDGHQITCSRRVIVDGKTFRDLDWQIRRERYFAELKVHGSQIDYVFGLHRVGDNRISPLLYKEIRSTLNQLRIRLNQIQPVQP